ncbi:hypothetical protein HAX54_048754, partial [Datura stramonium]|nr:hypothetical protein [Datura stramonium]
VRVGVGVRNRELGSESGVRVLGQDQELSFGSLSRFRSQIEGKSRIEFGRWVGVGSRGRGQQRDPESDLKQGQEPTSAPGSVSRVNQIESPIESGVRIEVRIWVSRVKASVISRKTTFSYKMVPGSLLALGTKLMPKSTWYDSIYRDVQA